MKHMNLITGLHTSVLQSHCLCVKGAISWANWKETRELSADTTKDKGVTC